MQKEKIRSGEKMKGRSDPEESAAC
uniref:Uncharacterized protein n=1 Tax=Rhizophora mucronata TaxID=61149 RepID=A0A2P2NEM5_RHIMU